MLLFFATVKAQNTPQFSYSTEYSSGVAEVTINCDATNQQLIQIEIGIEYGTSLAYTDMDWDSSWFNFDGVVSVSLENDTTNRYLTISLLRPAGNGTSGTGTVAKVRFGGSGIVQNIDLKRNHVQISIRTLDTGIEPTIFPNPARLGGEIVHVVSLEPLGVISVASLDGRYLRNFKPNPQSSETKSGWHTYSFSPQGLPPGLYLVKSKKKSLGKLWLK